MPAFPEQFIPKSLDQALSIALSRIPHSEKMAPLANQRGLIYAGSLVKEAAIN